MDKDASEREALRRKAEEARRAALRPECEEDDGILHVTGRPKFAPPVKSHKQDIFSEKLKSSLGAFEEVAPLLQTLKHRPIYGVSACPQTPAAIVANAPFSLDISDQQPSTSTANVADAGSFRGNGNKNSSRREKVSQSESSDKHRSPLPINGREKTRNRADEELNKPSLQSSNDRPRNGGRNDKHYSRTDSHHRRSNDDTQSHDARSQVHVKKEDGRTVQNHSLKDTESGRKHAVESPESAISDKHTSSRSRPTIESTSTPERRREISDRHVPSKSSAVGNGEEKDDGRNRAKNQKPLDVERIKNTKIEIDKADVSKSTDVDKVKGKSRSRSPVESNQRKEKDKKAVDTTTSSDRRQKTDQSINGTGKKHGQSTLRLDGLSSLHSGSKDNNNADDQLSTPAIEKMIKAVTGIVDAPPLSGIPSADPYRPPFSYPTKIEPLSQVSETFSTDHRFGNNRELHDSKTTLVDNRNGVLNSPASNGNGDERKPTLAEDLSLSESDGEISDSDDEISVLTNNQPSAVDDSRQLNLSRRRCVTTMNDFMTSPARAETHDRSYSESPKKDETPSQRSLATSAHSQLKPHVKSEPQWSISALLKSVTPAVLINNISESSADSDKAAATSPIASKNLKPAANSNSGKSSKRQKTMDPKLDQPSKTSNLKPEVTSKSTKTLDSEGEVKNEVETGIGELDKSSNLAITPNDDHSRPVLDGERRPDEQPLKMTVKMKGGKVLAVDSQKFRNDEEKRSGTNDAKGEQQIFSTASSPLNSFSEGSRKRKRSPVMERVGNNGNSKDTGKGLRESLKCVDGDEIRPGKDLTISISCEPDTDAILKEARLLPLLSPIREFPPLEFVNGRLTLLCQIPLNLLDRIPEKKVPRDYDDAQTTTQPRIGSGSDYENLCSKPASTGKQSGENEYGSTSSNTRDLDDVPILVRMNTNQKKRLSVSGPTSLSSTHAEDQKAAPKLNSPISKDKPKIRTTKDTNKSAPQSVSSKKRSISKNDKPTSKRKASEDVPDSPLNKAPKLEPIIAVFTDAPSEPVQIELDCEKEKQYLQKAKEVKHSADTQADKTLRILLYLESVVYFIMTGLCMEEMLIRRKKESSSPYTMLKTTVDLLTGVAEKFVNQMSVASNNMSTNFVSEIQVLSLRTQSLCHCKMYEMRQTQAISNYRQLAEFHKNSDRGSNSAPSSVGHPSSGNHQISISNTQHGGGGSERSNSANGDRGSGVTPSPTPSPASSTGSNHSLPPGSVAIPQQVEALYKQQLTNLHSLMWAHNYWQQATQKTQEANKVFFEHLDSLCGPLSLTSNLHSLCQYVLTGVTWLRQSHAKRLR